MDEKLYTKDQMLLWAGYCMGRKLDNPQEDVTNIWNDFVALFNIETNGT